ncbi:MAG: lipid II flippase MurJ [Candidatus Riflebacteria bacterium]|nr:lipid II flippase MurJ [Candidatus Riflebacteria bacterium]
MSLLNAFFSLSALTVLSRVSGFIKVAALAAFYGRSVEADMYMAVMLLPDLAYKFLSEGLVSCAAVPMFVELRDNKEKINNAFWTLTWISLIVALISVIFFTIFSKPICDNILPGFSGIEMQRVQFMWSVISIYLIFAIPSGVLTSFLNANMSFALPAVGPLLVNAFIIAGIFAASGGAIEKIVSATVLGAAAQAFWLLILVKKSKIFNLDFKTMFVFDKQAAKEFLCAVTPIAIWVSSLTLIPVYERYLLSMQTNGSLAALNYAEKLFNLPLGIISISLANVILPRLSQLKDKERKTFLFKAFAVAFVSVLPIVIFIWFFAETIVELVYKRGQFSLEDASVAAGLFKSYSLALLPVSLNLVLNRGFFAKRKYFLPFISGIISSAILFFVGAGFVAEFGVAGVGYAASIAYFVQTFILFICTVL